MKQIPRKSKVQKELENKLKRAENAKARHKAKADAYEKLIREGWRPKD